MVSLLVVEFGIFTSSDYFRRVTNNIICFGFDELKTTVTSFLTSVFLKSFPYSGSKVNSVIFIATNRSVLFVPDDVSDSFCKAFRISN